MIKDYLEALIAGRSFLCKTPQLSSRRRRVNPPEGDHSDSNRLTTFSLNFSGEKNRRRQHLAMTSPLRVTHKLLTDTKVTHTHTHSCTNSDNTFSRLLTGLTV